MNTKSFEGKLGEDTPLLRLQRQESIPTRQPHLDKSLGFFSSFALIVNNISGPGMMSLPQVFYGAGYVPATVIICFVYISSALTGTLFSQAISEIPGNKQFGENIGYVTAFRTLVNSQFAKIVETFFLTACGIQCSTGIVQAAQSLDAFLASYLIGETYALQMYPSVKWLRWSEDSCQSDGPISLETLDDCVPFFADGPLVITLGFVLVTLLFLPIGLHNLKETMIVQLVSFVFLVVVAVQFQVEFLSKGLTWDIPVFGTDYSMLVGVVLFNFDYVITVPAWLLEKKTDVSVNSMLWSTAGCCSLLYMSFGYLASRCFGPDTEKMMALMESNEMPVVTRWCAALFGICIIGAGVPVFSVIIKNTLFNANICDARWSLFFGSVCPYCISWVLYQGELVADVLSFAGLVINGLIAFVFPVSLCYIVYVLKTRPLPTHLEVFSSAGDSGGSEVEIGSPGNGRAAVGETMPNSTSLFSVPQDNGVYRHQALFDALRPYQACIIIALLIAFVTMISSTVILDAVFGLGA